MVKRLVAKIALTAAVAVAGIPVVTPVGSSEPRPDAQNRFATVHTIRTNNGTDQCALAVGAGDGSAVLQAPCSTSGWDFVEVGSSVGTYEIRHVASGRCLDAAGGGAPGDGVGVLLWTCHSGTNQRWIVRQRDDDTYEIKNSQTGNCLDVRLPTTWTPIYQWSCHGGREQQWVLR